MNNTPSIKPGDTAITWYNIPVEGCGDIKIIPMGSETDHFYASSREMCLCVLWMPFMARASPDCLENLNSENNSQQKGI